MKNFHGFGQKDSYFEGWYFKHQRCEDTACFIPGIHIDKSGNRSAFLQIITKEQSFYFTFPFSKFFVSKNMLFVQIGNNIFTEKGIEIDLVSNGMSIRGKIHYGAFSEIRYPIMGPFALLPRMQCHHEVISMSHTLRGWLMIGDQVMNFNDGLGYIEKDWGKSFPSRYVWTQCNQFPNQKIHLMAAAATVPLFSYRMKGCICSVQYRGKEYRLATYLGASVKRDSSEQMILKQGRYQFEVLLRKKQPQELKAPDIGQMSRIIHENAACTVRYTFKREEETLFDQESDQASFEFSEQSSED